MLRHITIILIGLLLTPMLVALGGFALYHVELATGWRESTRGVLARNVILPGVSIAIGIMVGALARSRPGILTTLILAPWAFLPVFKARLDSWQRLIVCLSGLLAICIGSVMAIWFFTLRARAKSRGNRLLVS